jgi:hypothetical protein
LLLYSSWSPGCGLQLPWCCPVALHAMQPVDVAHPSSQPTAFNPLRGVALVVVAGCTLTRHKGVTTVDILSSACNPFTLSLHISGHTRRLHMLAAELLPVDGAVNLSSHIICSTPVSAAATYQVAPMPQEVGVQATAQGPMTRFKRLKPVSPSNYSSAKVSTR